MNAVKSKSVVLLIAVDVGGQVSPRRHVIAKYSNWEQRKANFLTYHSFQCSMTFEIVVNYVLIWYFFYCTCAKSCERLRAGIITEALSRR